MKDGSEEDNYGKFVPLFSEPLFQNKGGIEGDELNDEAIYAGFAVYMLEGSDVKLHNLTRDAHKAGIL